MHPEFLREMTDLRGREMRARARQAKLSRLAILARRRRRHQADEVDGLVVPAIPDYVDGSFRTEPVDAEPTAAAHHAA
jgi:hypothetical protein